MFHARLACTLVLFSQLACGNDEAGGGHGSGSPGNTGATSGGSTGSTGHGTTGTGSADGSTTVSASTSGNDTADTTSGGACTDDDGDGLFAQPGCGTAPDCNDHSELLMTACPPSVILFVGDGMGSQHIMAARIFESGGGTPLSFETLPEAAMMASPNAAGAITDSAASSTAMSTGRKVENLVIARGIPGAGQDATTALELQQALTRSVGLVTTSAPINDATPAAFGAHDDSRYNWAAIASDYFEQTRPNVLFGEVGTGITHDAAVAAGYTVVTTAAQMLALDNTVETHVSGQFTSATIPVLGQMVVTALDLLDQAPEGFFLLVEHQGPDAGGHANDLEVVIGSVLELRDAFDAAMAWVGDRTDILVIVGADHETGGLEITDPSPTAGQIPLHTWGTSGHTSRLVPVFASDLGSGVVSGTIDNTDLFPLAAGLDGVAFRERQQGYTATADTFLDQGAPTASNGQSTSLWIDLDQLGDERQALLKFGALFGFQDDRVPWRAHIEVALLELQVADAGDPLQAHRMLVKWTPGDSWDDFGGDGIQADDVEALSQPEVVTGKALELGTLTLDVTDSVRHWQKAPASNHGWVLRSTGSDGVGIVSSEATTPPRLRVYFRPTE